MEGIIESWNRGFGIIRGIDNKTYLAHHTDFVAFQRNKRKIDPEPGQEATFIPHIRENKSVAIDIEYDTRISLFRFAYFQDYEGAIAELAKTFIGDKEKWSSSTFKKEDEEIRLTDLAKNQDWAQQEKNKQSERHGKVDQERVSSNVTRRIEKGIIRKEYDVLFSFFERTFERLQLEDKIVVSEYGAAFNTCLGNRFDKDIYAVFKRSTAPTSSSPYIFDRFGDVNYVGKNFPQIPEPPDYFTDPNTKMKVSADLLVLDTSLPIIPDDTHLFDERRSRFPDSWHEKTDEECASEFERLLERTRSRVRRNFRAAVPFYYPSLQKIQMLLPITFPIGGGNMETRALVVSREGAGYSVETIMPLEWAYKNARLLAKPDRDDWLDF